MKTVILSKQGRKKGRAKIKPAGTFKDEPGLCVNAIEVLKKRYLLKDDFQKVIETPDELFRRVASHVSCAEKNFRSSHKAKEAEEKFYHMMRDLEFMPNSPTLMNAGTSLGQLSACFVLPVEDSMDGIFESLYNMAKIHQSGGGTGFNFSNLRPKGGLVSSTKGEASGPVSFMKIFDKATDVIIQGGRRRGANMGILRCDHPDIVEFIEAKKKEGEFSNFNLSVAITDEFMEAVNKNSSFYLINQRTKKRTRRLKARYLFNLIADAAWHSGEPGLIFLDEINRKNPTPDAGRIESTNPCGEQPLLPYESCNLASINLSKMVKGSSFDWDKLRENVRWGVRFLDDVIEVNRFPLPRIKKITFANRKIGLGVMGFADCLIALGIPYGSEKAVDFAERLMGFIHKESIGTSAALARERGVFPNFKKSIYAKKNLRLRNASVNTIAPTGTISIIAGCSSGIEPIFSVTYVRNILSGVRLFEVNPLFKKIARETGFFNKEILIKVAQEGSLRNVKEIPEDIRRLFITAFDVTSEQHLKIQSAFQKYTDSSVSKTINLPAVASVNEVRKIYMMAYQLKCKGITVYRYGSKKDQVLTFNYEKKEPSMKSLITADSEYSGGCVSRSCSF